jgi:uncharacterized membrane protein
MGSQALKARVMPPLVLPRRVPFDAPWMWLAAGWRDLWTIPGISLTYGAVFAATAALGGLGLAHLDALSILPALFGGFLIVGPLVAVGLYDASRRLQRGERPRFMDVLTAGLTAPGQLGLFGSFLLFAFMVWMQLALLLLMLFLGDAAPPPPNAFVSALLFTQRGLGLLIVGTIVGGVIAAIIFSISTVSVPMMLERPVDAITAARASVAAVIANPKPMALWAALIAGVIVAGFATLLVGFVIAFPLIGHATWHAYMAIYGERTL